MGRLIANYLCFIVLLWTQFLELALCYGQPSGPIGLIGSISVGMHRDKIIH